MSWIVDVGYPIEAMHGEAIAKLASPAKIVSQNDRFGLHDLQIRTKNEEAAKIICQLVMQEIGLSDPSHLLSKADMIHNGTEYRGANRYVRYYKEPRTRWHLRSWIRAAQDNAGGTNA